MSDLAPFTGMTRRWFARVERKVQDCWIGVFWTREYPWSLDVWVCVLPMLPIHFGWRAQVSGRTRRLAMNPVDDPEFYCHGQKCIDAGCNPLRCIDMDAGHAAMQREYESRLRNAMERHANEPMAGRESDDAE